MASHSRHALHHLRELINRNPDRFTTDLYTRLFALDPDLRGLFGATLTHQRRAFFGVIDHVLEVIPAPTGQDEIVDFLAQLGRDHRKFGVLPEHYDLMYRALMIEFEKLMGSYWDDDAQSAISQAMMLTTGVMRGAAQMAEGPASWTAEVVEKYRISRDLAVVRLITDHPLDHASGQYLEVQIPQWPHTWRHLSPAIPPNERGELEFHIRAVPGGSFSPSIVTQTRAGDVWTIAQAHGTLHVDPERDVLMIAGGTGLAPLRALLIEMSMLVDQRRTHIFYGTRHPGELYDLAVLRRIAATNPWLRVTAVSEESTDPWWLNSAASPQDLGVEHRIGRLDDVVVTQGGWEQHQVLIAGSAAMIENTRNRLIISGVRASLIQHDPV